MTGSLLTKFFEGQPGVHYFDDPEQVEAWHQMRGHTTAAQPQQQQMPQFGGIAGWFQNWGRQQQGTQPSAQAAMQSFVPNGFQPPNGQKSVPSGGYSNHLFGGNRVGPSIPNMAPNSQNFLIGGRY